MKPTRRGILRALHSGGAQCLPGSYPQPSTADLLDMRREDLARELVKIGAETIHPDSWAGMAQCAIDAAMILYPEPEDDSEKGASE